MIELIKKFEGLKLKPYKCLAGYDTIGYGHIVQKNESFTEITEKDADRLLIQDIEAIAKQLDFLPKYLTKNEIDAILSLVFNLGVSFFKNSKMFKFLLKKDYEKMAKEWVDACKYRKNGVLTVSHGLLKRRIAELGVFFDV